MNIEYKKVIVHQCVDGVEEDTEVMLPDFAEGRTAPVGVWGRRHQTYLMEHKQDTYEELKNSGRLNAYLADVDWQAKEMLDRLTEEMKTREGVTEELKEKDQMVWVQAMENIRNRVEEITYREIVFR